jgi:hypothetical protein
MKSSKSKPTKAAKTRLVENPDYIQLLKEAKSVSYNQALSSIVKLLHTAQRLKETAVKFDSKTGKPVRFITAEDESSFPKYLFFMPDSSMGIEVHKSVAKKLTALLNKLEELNGSIVIRDAEKEDSQNLATIVMESISTGGGHNSMTTYSNALVFRSILLEESIDIS